MAVRGSVIDVSFPHCLPEIRDLLSLGDGVVAEVSAHLHTRTVRCLLVVSLGARTTRELSSRGLGPAEEVPLPGSVEAIGRLAEDLIIPIDGWRESEDVDRVVVFFHHPMRRIQRASRTFQVFPPDAGRLRGIAERPWPTPMLPGTPHEWAELLVGLLRQDLFIALYRAIAEAKAAEHGARLSTMQAAEQNIEERLEVLRNEYRRLRQAEITEQLLDIVSGFEALET